jgi:hypothetical protein
MRRALLMAVGVVALGLFAMQVPGDPALASADPCCQKACHVPVFVWLDGEDIKVEPEVLHLYWGTGVVFEVEAGADDLVEITFEKDPFKRGHAPGWHGTRGPSKVKTGSSLRPEDMREPDHTLIGRQKQKKEFKYSVRWSRGRAQRPLEVDPMIIMHDNGY